MQAGDRQVASRVDSTNQAVADHARRLDALDQELQAFRSEYQVTMEKVKTMLKFDVPVHFDFASSDLREVDRPVLDRFASVVKQYYPGAIITVEGFTDPAGSEPTIGGWANTEPSRCGNTSRRPVGSTARRSGR